jgi:hypothetical protein
MKTTARIGLMAMVAAVFLVIAVPLAVLAATDGVVAAQEAPAETSPPAETVPPTDTGADETPWWVLLIVLGGLFILIVALLAGRRKKPKSTGAVPAWRTHARAGYAEARWLADNMTESLAIWHGNAEHEGGAGSSATDTANAEVWDQIPERKQRAGAELYALEAASGPGSAALAASQLTTAALDDTYAALTERSDARAGYLAAGDASDEASESLTAARDREVRASGKLTASHQQLASALTKLKPVA